MGKTILKIKLENGKEIKEVVTDELLAHLSNEYRNIIGYGKPSFTFQEFVVQQLELRKERIKGVYKKDGK
ncbi:hypothetical protein [Bacillus phage vB_BanS-Thrax3]|nr:hypothetical protein [Bacillus phage vB_BanS-Thrax3]